MDRTWYLSKDCNWFHAAAFAQEMLTALHFHYAKIIGDKSDDRELHQKFRDKAESLLNNIVDHRASKTRVKFMFMFDERIWPPVEMDRYGKRGMVKIHYGPTTEFYLFRVDFDKPLELGVSLLGNPNGYEEYRDTDIFKVVYLDKDEIRKGKKNVV